MNNLNLAKNARPGFAVYSCHRPICPVGSSIPAKYYRPRFHE